MAIREKDNFLSVYKVIVAMGICEIIGTLIYYVVFKKEILAKIK